MAQWKTRPRLAVASAFITLPLLGLAVPVHAETILVNTFDDEIIDNSDCSLREAVTAANTNSAFNGCTTGSSGVVDEILLPAGTYTLDLGASGDDANLGGDLDITESVRIVGQGPLFVWWDDPLTVDEEVLDVFTAPLDWDAILDAGELPAIIIENGIGSSETRGDGDRILHIDPSTVGGVDVEVINVALRNGDVGCTKTDCFVGGAAIWDQGSGSLVLENSVIDSNTVSCSGEDCSTGTNSAVGPRPTGTSAIATTRGASLTLHRTAITNNTAICEDNGCRAGATVLVTREEADSDVVEISWTESLMGRNLNRCVGDYCAIEESLPLNVSNETIAQAVFWDNEISCLGLVCDSNEFFESDVNSPGGRSTSHQSWTDVEVSKNLLQCIGEPDPKFERGAPNRCDTDEIIDSFGDRVQTLNRVRFANNRLLCEGVDCDTDEIADEAAVFTNVDFLDNLIECVGDGCDADEMLDGGVLKGVRFLRNVSSCVGDNCGANYTADPSSQSLNENVTVSENQSKCVGTACRAFAIVSLDSLELRSSLITLNQSSCTGFNCWIGAECNVEDDFCPISEGGAVIAAGLVRVMDTTISDNSTTASGAGIVVKKDFSLLQLINSSVTNNDAVFDGGGVFNRGLISPGDSTLSGNTPMGTDCVDFDTGVGCADAIFIDGFDFGDTLSWSSTTP